jgi:hypothetical protein
MRQLWDRSTSNNPFSINRVDLAKDFGIGKVMKTEDMNRGIMYRLVDQYMSHPRLMKLNMINGDDNYLSFDAVSIAWTYCLNGSHPSLKYAIQFFLINPS